MGIYCLGKVEELSMKTLVSAVSLPRAWLWLYKQSYLQYSGWPSKVTQRSLMPSFSQIQWTCYRKLSLRWAVLTGMQPSWTTLNCEPLWFYPDLVRLGENEWRDRLTSTADVTTDLQLGKAKLLRGWAIFWTRSDQRVTIWSPTGGRNGILSEMAIGSHSETGNNLFSFKRGGLPWEDTWEVGLSMNTPFQELQCYFWGNPWEVGQSMNELFQVLQCYFSWNFLGCKSGAVFSFWKFSLPLYRNFNFFCIFFLGLKPHGEFFFALHVSSSSPSPIP